MAKEIKMPQLSDTMDAGKILVWHKKVGDEINRGDILAEVETDKANLEIEAFDKGTLLQIATAVGETAAVGSIIAVIGAKGESVSTNGSNGAPKEAQSAPEKVAPAAKEVAAAVPSPTQAPASVDSNGSSGRIKASPLARKIAMSQGIDLSTIEGSGPDGRIVKKDVEAASGGAPAAPSQAAQEVKPAYTPSTPRPASSGPVGGTSTALSKMRQTIARRMQESVTEAPHFYTTVSINMGETIRLREALKKKPDYKGISVNHFVVKAAAYALAHEPRVNGAIRNGELFQPDSINVGIIVAVDDGLLIPVIRDTDQLCMKDVVFEARAGVERARAGRPNSSDLSGGTFSISNLGMFDVENFTAIINPGQGAILAVSAIQDQPVVSGDKVVPGKIMKATLSVDHRIIDGVMAGTFMKHFRKSLEIPGLLLA